jgi:co-chaperonin GroES (HSP10)
VTDGGIYIPDVALRRPWHVWGEVIAVGPGFAITHGRRFRAGFRFDPIHVKPGDRVLFDTQGSMRLRMNEIEFTLIRAWSLMLIEERTQEAAE